MDIKSLFSITSIFLIFITGCQNEKQVNKEKYDSSINQVITLENKKLQSEGILNEHEILKREDVSIVVYTNGDYIELIYELKKNKQQKETLYKKEKSNMFTVIPTAKIKNGDVDEPTENTDYVENLILKE
ncbi:hypothetical protein [Bacillus sp. NPDC077027]|uniref:hypothetical protein n=1 Tax=Bacillus sp. NPDC077027 TaxID=3390548 RepID=UPI003D034DDF